MTDPRKEVGRETMTIKQVLAIGLCVLLNALDGFDVLTISFASPGIAKEWGIDRGALGIVLSMELIGMALGSVLLGQVTDRIGRRATTIGCLVVMAFGLLSTTQVDSIGLLAASRLITGFGIGGMLVTTNALVAEYSNDKWRGGAVAIMAAGYPVGGIVGGIAGNLLKTGDWRDVFFLGASITAMCLPLVPLLAPEPVGSLLHRRPADTLAKVDKSLRALGHGEIAELPPVEPDAPRAHISELIRPGLAAITVLLTAAYFLHVMTFYFILKWVPRSSSTWASAPRSLVACWFGPMLAGCCFRCSRSSARCAGC
jgi:MFS family permease